MKRTLITVTLAAAAATAVAADVSANDQYRNTAGKPEQHQLELGAIGSTYIVASADQHRSNAGKSTTDNYADQLQLGG